jgi:hypothetical protein
VKPLIAIATALLLTAIATTTALMADTLATKITTKTGTTDLQLESVDWECENRNTDVRYTATKTGNTYTIQIEVDPPGNSKDSCAVELVYRNTGTIPIKISTSTTYSGADSCTATPTGQLHTGDTATVTISISNCDGSCTCTAESTAKSWNQ